MTDRDATDLGRNIIVARLRELEGSTTKAARVRDPIAPRSGLAWLFVVDGYDVESIARYLGTSIQWVIMAIERVSRALGDQVPPTPGYYASGHRKPRHKRRGRRLPE